MPVANTLVRLGTLHGHLLQEREGGPTAEPSSLQMPEYALRVPPMPCEKIITGNGSCLSKIGACCTVKSVDN